MTAAASLLASAASVSAWGPVTRTCCRQEVASWAMQLAAGSQESGATANGTKVVAV